MGAWDELDTEISAEIDTSDLDMLLDIDDPYGIYEDGKQQARAIKEAIETGTKDGLEDLARRDKSFQEQIIASVCDNPSGMLASSIEYETDGEYSYIIGTRINHIYPMALEYGRSEVYPIRAKALAFYWNGELIFRKKVGRAKPRPFVAPAYDRVDQLTEPIMDAKIGIKLSKVMS